MIYRSLDSILPSIALLLGIWIFLGVTILYVRFKLKKEEKETSHSDITDKERQEFVDEIEKLAVYVSKLPRSKDIIIEYRNKENENDG